MSRDGKSASLKAGYIYAFLCSLFSALMIVLIKKAEETLPVLSVLLVMQALAGAMLTAALCAGGGLRMLRGTRRAGWAWIGVIVILTFFAYWTFFAALDLLDPTVASFLGRAETLVTISFGVIFLSERFLRGEIAGAALVLGGAAVIRSAGGVELSQGFFLCMLSALIWGVTEGLAKVAIRTVEPFVLTWARSVILVPAFLVAAALSPEGVVLPRTPDLWFTVIAENETARTAIIEQVTNRAGLDQVRELPMQRSFKLGVKFEL